MYICGKDTAEETALIVVTLLRSAVFFDIMQPWIIYIANEFNSFTICDKLMKCIFVQERDVC